jgi:myo-inositol-1(or 4)-monophosphatase
MNLEKVCNRVVEIARETGRFVKETREKGDLSVEVKGQNDFVTRVDKASQDRIVGALEGLVPGAGFILEEEDATKHKGREYNWIVDPIDGTTNFIHGAPPHAVSIALARGNELIIGVVYEIVLDEVFYAWKGGGTWLNGKKVTVSSTEKVADSLVATGFPYNDFSYLDPFMKTMDYFMKNSHGIRRLGSAATDLAYVSCGRYDSFYEYGLHAWDVAAGVVLIREAGGKVSDFKGGDDFLFGGNIVAANGSLFDEMFDVINNMMEKGIRH